MAIIEPPADLSFEQRLKQARVTIETALDDGIGYVGYFLRRAAVRQGLDVDVLMEKAERQDAVLTIPVRLHTTGLDVCERAMLLQRLEDEWNDRLPEPVYLLTLRPVKDIIEGKLPFERDEPALNQAV